MHLVSTAAHWLKVQEPQNLFHRDLGAQPVEVDPWHGLVPARKKKEQGGTVPFPHIYRERGTVPQLRRSVAALPTIRRAAELAGVLQRLQDLAQPVIVDG